uniref:Reelin domain-containing protein n=1 Tax=Macrostomum lignano TaxID=282301 RepID=A0A1I8FEF0_9PLAT
MPENNCVGHSTAGKDMYSSVTCSWTAPATNEGPIMFSCCLRFFGHTFDWLAVGLGDSDEMSDITDMKTRKIDFGHRRTQPACPFSPNRISCQFVRPVSTQPSPTNKYNMSSKSSSLISVTRKMSGEGKFVILGQGMNWRISVRLTPMGNKATVYFSGIEAKVQTHGTLMTTFWLFLMRPVKSSLPGTPPGPDAEAGQEASCGSSSTSAQWSLAYVLSRWLAFIYILVKQGRVHGIFGVIGMSLGLINIIAGIFRRTPRAPSTGRSLTGCTPLEAASVAIWLGAHIRSLRPEFPFLGRHRAGHLTRECQIIAMILFECLRIRAVRNKKLEGAISPTLFELTDKSTEIGGCHQTASRSRRSKASSSSNVSEGWLVAYACVFLALAAAAFWAGSVDALS